MALSPLGNGHVITLTDTERKRIPALRGSVQALVQVTGAEPMAYCVAHDPEGADMIFTLQPGDNMVLETQDQVDCFRASCATDNTTTQISVQQFMERG